MKNISILLLSSLFLVGCPGPGDSGFPKISYIWEVDADRNVLGKYEVISQKPLKIKYLQDVQLSDCDGCVAITHDDFVAIIKATNNKVILVNGEETQQ